MQVAVERNCGHSCNLLDKKYIHIYIYIYMYAALGTATWDELRKVLAPLVHKKAGERWYTT